VTTAGQSKIKSDENMASPDLCNFQVLCSSFANSFLKFNPVHLSRHIMQKYGFSPSLSLTFLLFFETLPSEFCAFEADTILQFPSNILPSSDMRL